MLILFIDAQKQKSRGKTWFKGRGRETDEFMFVYAQVKILLTNPNGYFYKPIEMWNRSLVENCGIEINM